MWYERSSQMKQLAFFEIRNFLCSSTRIYVWFWIRIWMQREEMLTWYFEYISLFQLFLSLHAAGLFFCVIWMPFIADRREPKHENILFKLKSHFIQFNRRIASRCTTVLSNEIIDLMNCCWVVALGCIGQWRFEAMALHAISTFDKHKHCILSVF